MTGLTSSILVATMSAIAIISVGLLLLSVAIIQKIRHMRHLIQHISENQQQWQQHFEQQHHDNLELKKEFQEHSIKSSKLIQESLNTTMQDVRHQIQTTLTSHTQHMQIHFDKLTATTQQKLHNISEEVDKKIGSSFEKTNATFQDVIKRLAIIDQAQQRITELSSNVVGLQQLLSNKHARGAFGEVQLAALIKNMIPEQHYQLQHTLSNGKRVDCLLILPEPTGHICIDAKFPLENYQHWQDNQSQLENKHYRQLFSADIKKHIDDISSKYIIENETASGAIMFLPAESIFAAIHSQFPDIIEYAHRKQVWLVSPTTLMAILTTSRAVLKDAATKKQVHIIQEHLCKLGEDFGRFQKRMDQLAKHIGQAHQDVEQVHRSSQKITQRFHKIEQVDISPLTDKEPITHINTAIQKDQEYVDH